MGDAADIITKFVAPTLGVIMANCMFLTPMKAVLRVRKEERLGVRAYTSISYLLPADSAF